VNPGSEPHKGVDEIFAEQNEGASAREEREGFREKVRSLEVEAELKRLAGLTLDVYQRQRLSAAESLGWRVSDLDAEVKRRRKERGKQSSKTKPKEEDAGADGIKPCFRLTDTEVQYGEADDEGEVQWTTVCSRLEIVAMTRNPNGEEWGRVLHFGDDDGREHEWSMPMAMLAGDGSGYRERLLEQGLHIAPGKRAREHLYEYVLTTRPTARARAVSRLGWHGDVFVLPYRVFGECPKERIVCQTVNPVDHAFMISGTLKEWQDNVGILCVGNSRLILNVSAAFVAPLLHLVRAESAGLHNRGPSSIGKTTLLQVGGSIWGGGGDHGYCRQWRATANGLESTAAMHSDALLCLDEIAELTAKEAGMVAYMLANGEGKQRARRDGSGRPPATWRLFFLSSGEVSLADKIAEDGRRRATAGQSVRVIDVPGDAGVGLGVFEDLRGLKSGHELAERLKAATSQFYGSPSEAFLEKLVTDRQPCIDAIAASRKSFRDEHCAQQSNGQVLRVASHFGLIAAAGELAIAMGILPWDEGAADEAAAICFLAWLESRGGTGPAEIEAGIRQIRKFFELHGESRFTPIDRAERRDSNGVLIEDRPTVNRAGFRRDTDAGAEFFVLPECFREELCAGLDAPALARELVTRGYLKPDAQGRTSVNHKVSGASIRVYHFLPAILSQDDEPDDHDQHREQRDDPDRELKSANSVDGDEDIPF
jgi:putative DNA primase/helicase